MSVIEDHLGQMGRHEPETVEAYLEHACGWQYKTESYVSLCDEGGPVYGPDGFQMDARIRYRNSQDVGIEAKQFVTDGLELLKGDPTHGIGQAVRYAYHCDSAELWHFYVVPFSINTIEQDCALSLMASLHERVSGWLDAHPDLTLRSIAIRHQRDEVQPLATLGESVVGEPSSTPTDLKQTSMTLVPDLDADADPDQ